MVQAEFVWCVKNNKQRNVQMEKCLLKKCPDKEMFGWRIVRIPSHPPTGETTTTTCPCPLTNILYFYEVPTLKSFLYFTLSIFEEMWVAKKFRVGTAIVNYSSNSISILEDDSCPLLALKKLFTLKLYQYINIHSCINFDKYLPLFTFCTLWLNETCNVTGLNDTCNVTVWVADTKQIVIIRFGHFYS